MTVFVCPICRRQYSTDSTRKSIVAMMRRNATLCELECRQRVESKFGAGNRSLFELESLYRKLTHAQN
jgi:hypothetical protein